MSLLCRGDGCVAYGAHSTGCAGDPYCTGCQPKPAADGLVLCVRCVDLLAGYFPKTAENHDALLLVLNGKRQGLAEVVSGTRELGLVLNEAAASARWEIESALTRWSHFVSVQRAHTIPEPRSWETLAAFLATNVRWLAAQASGGDVFATFRELAHGWAWRAAYPTASRRSVTLGVCLVDGCPGFVSAHTADDSLSLDYVACDQDEAHRWDRAQFGAFWPRLADLERPPVLTTAEVAAILGVSEDSVRQFVRGKRLQRVSGGGFLPDGVLKLRKELWDDGGVPSVALRLYDPTGERPHTGRARVQTAASD